MKSYKIFFTLIIIALCSFISCNNEESAIGTSIIPSGDIMELCCDTLDVECYVVRDSLVETQNKSLSPIGCLNDDIFGYTKASCIFQTMLSTENVVFEKEIDIHNSEAMNSLKLILNLKVKSWYGDASSNMVIKVNRLLTDIYYDSTYYENMTLEASQYEEIISANANFSETDSTIVIELPNTLAQEIVNQNAGDSVWKNDKFMKYFKGFYLTCDDIATGGCIFNINLISSASNMTLKYKNSSNEEKSFVFNIDEYCSRINLFEHDYSSACTELKTALANPDQSSEYGFIQGFGGTKVVLKFPEIYGLFLDKNIIINRAQLKLYVKNNETFEVPASLNMTKNLSTGLYDFVEDYKSNSTYFGGKFISDGYYIYNLPLYIQSQISEIENYGITLVAVDNRISPNRVMFYGDGDDAKSLKLEIYYSKY